MKQFLFPYGRSLSLQIVLKVYGTCSMYVWREFCNESQSIKRLLELYMKRRQGINILRVGGKRKLCEKTSCSSVLVLQTIYYNNNIIITDDVYHYHYQLFLDRKHSILLVVFIVVASCTRECYTAISNLTLNRFWYSKPFVYDVTNSFNNSGS